MSVYRCIHCYYFSAKINEDLETVYKDDRCLFHKSVIEKPNVTWCVDFKQEVDKDVTKIM